MAKSAKTGNARKQCRELLERAGRGWIHAGWRNRDTEGVLREARSIPIHVEALLAIRVAHTELLAAERFASRVRNHGSDRADVFAAAVIVLIWAATVVIGIALSGADRQLVGAVIGLGESIGAIADLRRDHAQTRRAIWSRVHERHPAGHFRSKWIIAGSADLIIGTPRKQQGDAERAKRKPRGKTALHT